MCAYIIILLVGNKLLNMIVYENKHSCISKHPLKKHGKGIINTLINKLPIELHFPGYQYCGPGTKLKERLSRGDPGINLLDKACKEHDISYSKHKNTSNRHIADRILEEKAWQRVKSNDASFGERANALLVTNLMKAKVKLGMGLKKNGVGMKMKRKASFREAVKNARKIIGIKKPDNIKHAIKLALNAAKDVIKRKRKSISTPRIIPIPKIGGVLPFLIPLFAGLSAVGALSGGAASIAKAVNNANNAKKQLEESQRHNKTMEAIAMGNGLYLKPYRSGLGLYLKPHPKN